MAVVRDPAFWRRFSMAVHQDEEKGSFADNQSASTGYSKQGLKHTDSWLERTRKKQRRAWICGGMIALLVAAAIVAAVFVVMYVLKVGVFAS
ncbi:hypothetical protein DV736_g4872, partial [Chaetothyriales sp. CBS 134916]